MTSFISHTSIDCADPTALARWWAGVLGYEDVPDDPDQPDEERAIRDPETGHEVLFLKVPEPKSTKNRVHFDLRPRIGTRDEELARLVASGATVVADHRGRFGPGTGWVVLADPEGNEFCLLRSPGELAQSVSAG